LEFRRVLFRSRVGAQDQLADRRATAQADDDELGTALLRDRDQVLARLVAADQGPHLVLDAVSVQLALHPGQLVLEALRLAGVEVTAAAVRNNNDQREVYQRRLLIGPAQRCPAILGR